MELQIIQNKIYEIKGLQVMFDFDLAEMYQVETRRQHFLKQSEAAPIVSDLAFLLYLYKKQDIIWNYKSSKTKFTKSRDYR